MNPISLLFPFSISGEHKALNLGQITSRESHTLLGLLQAPRGTVRAKWTVHTTKQLIQCDNRSRSKPAPVNGPPCLSILFSAVAILPETYSTT